MTVDYRQYPVLYIDDEPANLIALRYALEDDFDLLTATRGADALEILARTDVAVLLCDQRMPEMSGVEVCERARALRPDTVRIMVTAYADLHAAIDAINRGQVSRYLAKPFRNEDLAEVLRTAIEIVHLQRTVRDMELRLLRSGQTHTASFLHTELAHELNNVLGALGLSVQQLHELSDEALTSFRRDPVLAEHALASMGEALADTTAAVQQLGAMVKRLRRTDPRVARPSECDVARVIDSTVRILRIELEKVASLRVVTEASPMVTFDASAFAQVLINLLLNAAQALDVTRRHENVVTVRVATAPGFAEVTIVDNGPGIAPEVLGRVFDAYFTTKPAGSGLGLAIVRDLVERGGGRIHAESQYGRGASFLVRLPLVSSG